MSFDPRSPSDCADMAEDAVAVCQFCDEVIDQSDMNVEAFEIAACPCCVECAVEVYGPLSSDDITSALAEQQLQGSL